MSHEHMLRGERQLEAKMRAATPSPRLRGTSQTLTVTSSSELTVEYRGTKTSPLSMPITKWSWRSASATRPATPCTCYECWSGSRKIRTSCQQRGHGAYISASRQQYGHQSRPSGGRPPKNLNARPGIAEAPIQSGRSDLCSAQDHC
jgi:hypothetical protein